MAAMTTRDHEKNNKKAVKQPRVRAKSKPQELEKRKKINQQIQSIGISVGLVQTANWQSFFLKGDNQPAFCKGAVVPAVAISRRSGNNSHVMQE